MDLDIQHLAREGVHGPAMIERMVGHLPDLQQIWTGAPGGFAAKPDLKATNPKTKILASEKVSGFRP